MISKALKSFLVGMLSCCCVSVSAADNVALDQLKTAYLFNFAKFVTWADAPQVVVLCVDEATLARQSVATLDGRLIDESRTLSVTFVSDLPSACHMYFGAQLFASDKVSASAMLAADSVATSNSVLTISDTPGALALGFAFEFFLDSKKLRFAVSTDELEQADYQVSSRLLQLARPVR